MQYLRREGRYVEAPVPDLIFFDAIDLDPSAISLLKKMKADSEVRSTPIVLLANDDSLAALDDVWAGDDNYAAFSPVELDSFLSALNAIKTQRFMDAISLLENFGFVLVRMPEANEGLAAHARPGTPAGSSRRDLRRSA